MTKFHEQRKSLVLLAACLKLRVRITKPTVVAKGDTAIYQRTRLPNTIIKAQKRRVSQKADKRTKNRRIPQRERKSLQRLMV